MVDEGLLPPGRRPPNALRREALEEPLCPADGSRPAERDLPARCALGEPAGGPPPHRAGERAEQGDGLFPGPLSPAPDDVPLGSWLPIRTGGRGTCRHLPARLGPGVKTMTEQSAGCGIWVREVPCGHLRFACGKERLATSARRSSTPRPLKELRHGTQVGRRVL